MSDAAALCWKFVALLVGFLTPFAVELVGKLPIAELVLLGVAALVVIDLCLRQQLPAAFRSRLLWMFLGALAIVLCSYIVADLYRESAMRDMARGWSRLVFLAIDIAAVAVLFGASQSAFQWAQVGAAAGMVAAMAIYGPHLDDAWKFGVGLPVTIVAAIVAARFGKWMSVLALAALGALHFGMDYRSLGGICLLAAVLLALQALPIRARPLLTVPALIVGVVAAAILYGTGAEAQERAARSNVERGAMMLAAWNGFQQSPLIGQGSWFSRSRVLDEFVMLRSERAKLADVHGYQDQLEDDVAIHSQLLVSLAEGGLFGGSFFLIFGAALGWALLYCGFARPLDHLTPLYLLTLLLACWNLLCSPFSGAHRVEIAFACGLILLLRRESSEAAAATE